MDNPNFLTEEAGLNFGTVVESIIKRSCIIDYGIIQDVVADGVVDVSVAVSRTKQDMFCMTCVLANIASSAFTLNIKPHKGDRVLVVYPRIYNNAMFKVTTDESKNAELIEDFNAKGYNLASGIAILINQYKSAGHKNVVTIDKDSIEVEVLEGKTKMQIDSSGNITVDTNGKYTIKNSVTDLLTVISDLNTVLKSLKTTGSQTAQTISADTVAQLAQWENSELKALLNTSST